ncbi:M10 family metallopeptidase C-terminal domain-containing protein [Yoonia sp. BS5-3]|uniref:M10 family metallopeptidase C-terminal domain-containing protein n=1 Tax=Yoonia phaeophyticola TaxID=3137369 RepID=A0ABZ2V5W7_9RHOB
MCEVCQALANTSAAISGVSGDCPTDSLDGGTYRTDDVITVYFVTNGQEANAADEINDPTGSDEIESDGWTLYEQQRVEAALAAISNYIDITFQVTTNANADFQLVLDDDEFPSSGFLGYFYSPAFAGDNSAVMGAFNANGFGWSEAGLDDGGLGYATIIHELLHGLGLDHPHDGVTIMEGLAGSASDPNYPFGFYGDYDLNQQVYTIMSYNDGWFGDPASDTDGNAATPMALDIAILQELYGANTTYNSGSNDYDLGDAAWVGIWDTGGSDTITYTGNNDATIDLRAATLQYADGGGGYLSYVEGIAGGYTIANGAVIENATGGDGDDTLIGNAVDNVLVGNGGSDEIIGGRGDDEIDTGTGNDEANGNSGSDEISADSGTNTLFGSSGFDDITGGTGVDIIDGGSGDDNISGGNGGDTIYGGKGDDTISGDGGADIIIGGLGADTLTGGAGADDFVFEFISDSYADSTRRDTITDFETGTDDIDLSNIGGLTFVGTTGFSNTAGEVRLEESGGDTIVQLDSDGDGNADLEIFVDGVTGLSSGDFIL